MSNAVKNRSLIYGVMILVLAIMVMRSLLESLNDNAQEQSVNNPPIGTQKFWIDKDKDSVVVYHHNRLWQNNYGNAYQSNLIVRHKDVSQAIASHKIMNPEASTNFWGALYAQMVQESSPKLDLILDAFYQIYQQQPMSAELFAEMIVSCIQNIPYALILPKNCDQTQHNEEWILELFSDCPDCCLGDQPFGLQTPLGFMKNLKGDCDTRTVFLFSVLSAFNYDVAILNSDVYRHSILGLNLPQTGQYKLFYGKKYLVWETTAPHHVLGTLPPQISNMNFWNVVLTNDPIMN